MIFDLDITETPNSERIFVNLFSKQPHSYGQIKAVLDTGSPTTVISYSDALKLNLPVINANAGNPIAGFGKGKIPSKKLDRFLFALKSNDNRIKVLEMPVNIIDISTLRNMPQDMQASTMRVPTIVGLDFLRNTKMKLVINLEQHKAFLESQEE